MSPASDLAAGAFPSWSSVVLPPRAAAAASSPTPIPFPWPAESTSLEPRLPKRARKARPEVPSLLWADSACSPGESMESSSWETQGKSLLFLGPQSSHLGSELISKAEFPRQICSPYDLPVPAWKILTEQVWGGGNRNLLGGIVLSLEFLFLSLTTVPSLN